MKRVAALVLLTLTVLAMTQLTNVNASSKLTVGTWWTLKGNSNGSYSGTGSDQGSLSSTDNFTIKYFVSSVNSDTITIHQHVDGSETCTSTQKWTCSQSGTSTWSNDRDYTVALSTLAITSYVDNGKSYSDLVGHPAWILTNPRALTEQGASPVTWWVPTSDLKSWTITDVEASVSTQLMLLKGHEVSVWVISYTGQVPGELSNSNGVYSVGPETQAFLYDPEYGLVVGASFSRVSAGSETGNAGNWTEHYIESDQFVDSSLPFTAAVTIAVQPTANMSAIVDGVNYPSTKLPTTFNWFMGTNHSLQVNSTLQNGGTRYVFLQWSDGSTLNSKNFTALTDITLTANYKTQYMLTVVSDAGNPQGTGWYDSGTQAMFSVTTPVPEPGVLGMLGGKLLFQGWSGDSKSTSKSVTITMNGPKTVTAVWTQDNTQPLLILGGIVAVIAVAVAALVFMKRRKP